MKKIITLFLIVSLFTNCSSNDNDTDQNPVIGTWKLIKTEKRVSGVNGTVFTDYSAQNIMYKFDTKTNLTVTNGKETNTYKYEYKFDYLSANNSPEETKINMVVIESSKYAYHLIDGQMKLELSYIDGEDLYFEKQ